MSKSLQLYHLKQYFTAVKNDLCNNDLNCKMESSKEELSNIFTTNNFIKIRTDILYKQYFAFNYIYTYISHENEVVKWWGIYHTATLISEYNFWFKQMLMPSGQDLKKICFEIIVLVICLYLSIVLFKKGYLH